MRPFRKSAALLLGLVFFVAGVLKLMDPVGTGLVVESYFRFLHLGFLAPASYVCGLVAAMLEAVTGSLILTGVQLRPAAFLSALMLGFFTILTAVVWVFNPAMDCGCFGEAVHLSHAGSFLKNLVLDALWVFAFVPMRDFPLPRKVKYVSLAVTVCSLVVFSLYSALSIPLVDYTPLKPGAELLKPGPETLDPETDEWIPSAAGEQPLSFYRAGGEYCDSLAFDGKVAVVSVYDVGKLSEKSWKRISKFVVAASEAGFSTLVLVASDPDAIDELSIDMAVLPYIYFADRRTLMTLNRSNGGVTFVGDGQIVGKLAAASLPDADSLKELYLREPSAVAMDNSSAGSVRLQGFLLYCAAVMLLL